jgi:hypothetical protein
MLNKRNQTFETNSSSTHAICIVKKENNIHIPDKIDIDLNDYEFGWEFKEYDDYDEKLAYILIGILQYRDIIIASERLHILLEMIKEIGVKRIEIKGIIIEHDEYENEPYFYISDGYVDHSTELNELIEALLSDKDLLKRYLFEINSFIATGNDNDDEPVINRDNMEDYNTYWKGN